MNLQLIRLLLRLFDLIAEQAEALRYRDAENKDFWAGVNRDCRSIKVSIQDKFEF